MVFPMLFKGSSSKAMLLIFVVEVIRNAHSWFYHPKSQFVQEDFTFIDDVEDWGYSDQSC